MIAFFHSLWENNEKLLEILRFLSFKRSCCLAISIGTWIMANLGEAILVCLEKLVV